MNHATSGDIAVMIVRNRDRIARNMVEYLEVWQKLADAGVALVLSDKGATPVSNNFSEEAWNALMAEIEGDNIAGRTQAASRFYPPAPFVYEKIGRKGNTHYEFTQDIDDVKDLFEAFEAVAGKDEYKDVPSHLEKADGSVSGQDSPESILCSSDSRRGKCEAVTARATHRPGRNRTGKLTSPDRVGFCSHRESPSSSVAGVCTPVLQSLHGSA